MSKCTANPAQYDVVLAPNTWGDYFCNHHQLASRTRWQANIWPVIAGCFPFPQLSGNVISNAIAPMVGCLGMVAGINQGGNLLVAEPVHGTPKHLEGKGVANPIAAMRAAAMIVQVAAFILHLHRASRQAQCKSAPCTILF